MSSAEHLKQLCLQISEVFDVVYSRVYFRFRCMVRWQALYQGNVTAAPTEIPPLQFWIICFSYPIRALLCHTFPQLP